ncbi:IS1 family transposase [Aeromonas salmonicida]
MVTLTIYCPRCQSDRAYRHGKTRLCSQNAGFLPTNSSRK